MARDFMHFEAGGEEVEFGFPNLPVNQRPTPEQVDASIAAQRTSKTQGAEVPDDDEPSELDEWLYDLEPHQLALEYKKLKQQLDRRMLTFVSRYGQTLQNGAITFTVPAGSIKLDGTVEVPVPADIE